MLKCKSRVAATGQDVIILGLTSAEINNITKQGMYLHVDGASIGASVNVVLFCGETEAEMLEMVSDLMDENTNIVVDPALMN